MLARPFNARMCTHYGFTSVFLGPPCNFTMAPVVKKSGRNKPGSRVDRSSERPFTKVELVALADDACKMRRERVLEETAGRGTG